MVLPRSPDHSSRSLCDVLGGSGQSQKGRCQLQYSVWCISSFLHPVFPEPLLSTRPCAGQNRGGTHKMSRPRPCPVGRLGCRGDRGGHRWSWPREMEVVLEREPGGTPHPARGHQGRLPGEGGEVSWQEGRTCSRQRSLCKGSAPD